VRALPHSRGGPFAPRARWRVRVCGWYLASLLGLVDAELREIGIVPTTEAVGLVPNTLTVTDDHELVSGGSSIGH